MFNIGFYSQSARMGKSTCAKYLIEKYGYNMLTFASPMKDMLEIPLRKLGYSEEVIYEMLYGSMKEYVIPELNATPRKLLVTLGSGWGRGMIDDNMWINIACSSLDVNERFVCEDVRLPNEAETLHNKGFKIIKIVNSRVPIVESVSEGKLENYVFDEIVINEGTIPELYSRLDDIISSWKEGV